MSKSIVLGLDTSCYTTSVAAKVGEQMIHIKKMLDVKEGECGLRQSDALFQHIKNLPVLFEDIKSSVNPKNFEKITVARC